MNKIIFTNFFPCGNYPNSKHALFRIIMLVLVLFTGSVSALYAQPPTGVTVEFENGPARVLVASSPSPAATNIDGKALTVAVNNTSGAHNININNTFASVTGGTDLGVIATNSGGVASYYTLKSDNNAYNWGITSLEFGIALGSAQNVKIQGYDNGVAVSGTIVKALTGGGITAFTLVSSDFSTAGGFTNIDEIRFTLTTPVVSNFAIDAVLLAPASGGCVAPTAQVTGLGFGTVTGNSIQLNSFTAPAGGATGYVVIANTSNTFTAPSDGALPSANTVYGGGQQVVYAGTSNAGVTSTGLSQNTSYYFKVYAYNDCSGTNTFEITGTEANTATLDVTPPIVTSVTVPANGTYKAGQNLDLIINFSENLIVNTGGGTPQLSITIGATARQAVYLSGSGTSGLFFRYAVQAGELDADGIAVNTLAANGATLRDVATNDANLTLNSVGSTTAVFVDAVAPMVTSVTVPANGTYIADQNLDFIINFNENVTVNTGGGTPQLSLTIGASARQAVYQSGTGTSALLFRYTIQAAELDADGITANTLAANGATLHDTATNNANLTLNSVGSTTAVLVDAVAPTVTSVTVPANGTYIAGQNLDFMINFNENVTVNTGGGSPQLSITIGATTRQAVYLSGTGTSALLFRYAVQAGELDADGIAVGALGANGGTLRDAATNDANLTLNSVGSTTAVLVDAVAPTVTSVTVPANGTYKAGQNLDFIINFNENVTVNTGGGTPQLSIIIGATTRQAVYLSGSGTSGLFFRYAVQAGELDADGIAVNTLAANGATLRDAATNDANLTLNSVGSTTAVFVDAVAPMVTSVTVPANGTYIPGQNLDFIINFNENVTVNTGGGSPQLSITIGATTRQAVYLSGTGTFALLFRYTVQVGELDVNGIAVNTLATNGATLRDTTTNDANLTLNSVGSTTALLVDAVAPMVTSVTVPANGTYIAGQNLDFIINFNENVTVNTGGGTSQLSITIGATTRQALNLSGSGTAALLFRYTVQAGELDVDGITVNTLAANGSTLRDAATNDANLTLNSVGSTASVFVDATLSIGEMDYNTNKIKIFPNPSSNYIKISGLKSIEKYYVYNVLGVQINNGTIFNNQEIDITNLENGIYFIKINKLQPVKFIKK